jgi:hypothetical protein
MGRSVTHVRLEGLAKQLGGRIELTIPQPGEALGVAFPGLLGVAKGIGPDRSIANVRLHGGLGIAG